MELQISANQEYREPYPDIIPVPALKPIRLLLNK
jgi:hypothetical protein